jgi:DNA-binding MarR family transcriptional regulator
MLNDGPLPITVTLWDTVQRTMRAFEALLAEHGGTRQIWHILLNLQLGPPATQRQLAASLGIREATLTHHLRAMEERGLIQRHREPTNQRIQRIAVTPAGRDLFDALKDRALDFDARLRRSIGGPAAVADLEAALGRIRAVLPDDAAPVPFE